MLFVLLCHSALRTVAQHSCISVHSLAQSTHLGKHIYLDPSSDSLASPPPCVLVVLDPPDVGEFRSKDRGSAWRVADFVFEWEEG